MAYGLGGVINWFMSINLVLKVSIFSYHPFAAAIVGVVSGTIFNSMLLRFWVLKRKSTPPS